ncbi:hypothetical protein Tco_0519912 [Tanacetum coccineum]
MHNGMQIRRKKRSRTASHQELKPMEVYAQRQNYTWTFRPTNFSLTSVPDVKSDRSMEIRLVYGMAFKSSWFRNWAYKFGARSFGVAEDKYRGSVQFLSEIDLDMIIKVKTRSKVKGNGPKKKIGRIDKQCMERWQNHLRPDIKIPLVSYGKSDGYGSDCVFRGYGKDVVVASSLTE